MVVPSSTSNSRPLDAYTAVDAGTLATNTSELRKHVFSGTSRYIKLLTSLGISTRSITHPRRRHRSGYARELARSRVRVLEQYYLVRLVRKPATRPGDAYDEGIDRRLEQAFWIPHSGRRRRVLYIYGPNSVQ